MTVLQALVAFITVTSSLCASRGSRSVLLSKSTVPDAPFVLSTFGSRRGWLEASDARRAHGSSTDQWSAAKFPVGHDRLSLRVLQQRSQENCEKIRCVPALHLDRLKGETDAGLVAVRTMLEARASVDHLLADETLLDTKGVFRLEGDPCFVHERRRRGV